MNALTSPLEFVELARAIPDRNSRWGMLGRLIWLSVRPSVRRTYRRLVERQLDQRGSVPTDVWKTPARAAIANEIETILAVACWGERFSFHPDDPWLVIGDCEIGDLSEVDAIFRIERRFPTGLSLKEYGDRIKQGMTFGDLVTLIEEARQQGE